MKLIRKILLLIILLILFLGTILTYQGYAMYKDALEKISVQDMVKAFRIQENYTLINDLPEFYLNAVISAEDHRFYRHGALDFIGIGRAICTNVKSFQLKEGGSSITQQVAKNVYFTQEKTALRKIAEIFMAFEIEKNCDKDTILEIYVNTSYFGNGYYGIKEASNGYYNKEPIEMNEYECSMLAGVPNAPSVYAPSKNPNLAAQRQRQVLDKMIRYNYITEEEKEKILNN